MLPNAYTKKEILENLASKGQFVDSYTLNSFFEKWQIEAIFEDEAGQEFYDKSTLDLVCEKLFAGNTSQNAGQNINSPQPSNNNSIQTEEQSQTTGQIAQPENLALNQGAAPPKAKTYAYNQPQQYGQNVQPQVPVQPQIPPPVQPQIQPQVPPPVPPQMPQYQGGMTNMQMPYSGQQQYQNVPYQQNMPYQQNVPYQQSAPIQQPYMQYNSFQNNAFPQQNVQMPQQSAQQSSWGQERTAPPKLSIGEEFSIDDPQTSKILNGISLSDGKPLMNRIKTDTGLKDYTGETALVDDLSDEEILKPLKTEKQSKTGLLSGAMEAAGITELEGQNEADAKDTPDIDDISLLSESMEAQEKFRQYVVSELAKKNVDLTPQGNEFKLDISERTINMIARTVAKKIAKNVTAILTNDKYSPQGGALKEQNEKLMQKAKELEEENKKLRLLLVESNKNINSFKSILGIFYIKIKPKAKKKK